MFRRISYRIALQFTAFVFILLLLNGVLFLAADVTNARRQTRFRLAQTAATVLERAMNDPGAAQTLPQRIRDRIRILDLKGNVLYSGWIFTNLPFSHDHEFSYEFLQNDRYMVLTTPVITDGEMSGYMQIAEMERLPVGDLPERAAIYLLVSALISGLTFLVGLFFARRSLRPAEEMVKRLEQFTQDASHELRTPLAALNSSLDLALRTQNYHEGILSAKEDLREVSTLVERLLELARLDTFVMQNAPIDLSSLTETMVERHRPIAAARNVTIEPHNLRPGVMTRGDASLVRQIIGNLLTNAIKFSKPGGGVIRVTLTEKELHIMDTGVGMKPQAIAHIFDRFYQADNSRTNDGFGLGLALVKRIVDLHGWSIGVKSKEGEGTTFTVRFFPHS